MNRQANIKRTTFETDIHVQVDLDNKQPVDIKTGIGFLDHMLMQIAKHAKIGILIKCQGDYHIDDHHSVEDIGIALGQAFSKALSDKKGIYRYGSSYVPLDESLVRAVIDLSGRPGLYFSVSFKREKIGTFDTELVREFFQGLVNHSAMTLHLDLIKGENAHHVAEATFKAFAQALRIAIAYDANSQGEIPSTKGSL